MSTRIEVSSEYRSQVEALGHEVADFIRACDAWYKVSETGTQHAQLMDEYALEFFVEFQRGVQDAIILQLGRLAGAPKSCGQDNLTVRGVVDGVLPLLDTNARSKLEASVENFERHAKAFAKQRHKRLAHTDLGFATKHDWHRLPTGKNEDITIARAELESIRKQLDEAIEGDMLFTDHQCEAMGIGDVLFALERCDVWTRLRMAESEFTDAELRKAVRTGMLPQATLEMKN